jgi:hypothetical protein
MCKVLSGQQLAAGKSWLTCLYRVISSFNAQYLYQNRADQFFFLLANSLSINLK